VRQLLTNARYAQRFGSSVSHIQLIDATRYHWCGRTYDGDVALLAGVEQQLATGRPSTIKTIDHDGIEAATTSTVSNSRNWLGRTGRIKRTLIKPSLRQARPLVSSRLVSVLDDSHWTCLLCNVSAPVTLSRIRVAAIDYRIGYIGRCYHAL
jgi:hypothetical protein